MAFTLCADPERVRYQDMVGKRLRVECGFPALPGNVNTVVHHLDSFEMRENARMDWVAHACCVLAIVSRRSRTFFGTFTDGTRAKTQDCFGDTPKPARKMRAFPTMSERRVGKLPLVRS